MPEPQSVRVTLSLQAFRTLLQRGVGVPQATCVGVREFLQVTLGIEADYVEERLQTVFLDGRPVDDLDRTLVGPGAALALSGAMPGLAGATMRRGGYYARMREGITHSGAAGEEGKGGAGIVIVKLFNRPLADLAESLTDLPLLVPADALDALDGRGSETTDGEWVRVAVTLVGERQT